jgi:hypothetical protein
MKLPFARNRRTWVMVTDMLWQGEEWKNGRSRKKMLVFSFSEIQETQYM